MDLNTLKRANELNAAIEDLTKKIETADSKAEQKAYMQLGNGKTITIPQDLVEQLYYSWSRRMEKERAALVAEFEALMPQGNTTVAINDEI